MSTRVYSPSGEPFDIVRRDTADKLILEEGWTQTPPVPATEVMEEEAPKKKRRSSRKEKPVEEELVEAPEENEEPETVDE